MSKIGKKPITIPEGIAANIDGSLLNVSKGNHTKALEIPKTINVKIENNKISVTRKDEEKETKSLHGLTARLIGNAIKGVSDGFERKLEFTGTGYRVAVAGKDLVLNMGYSHEVRFTIPEGLEVSVVKNVILIKGAEKDTVGQFASVVRGVRPPEPYKGKGIKYSDEIIRRKAGKAAGK